MVWVQTSPLEVVAGAGHVTRFDGSKEISREAQRLSPVRVDVEITKSGRVPDRALVLGFFRSALSRAVPVWDSTIGKENTSVKFFQVGAVFC